MFNLTPEEKKVILFVLAACMLGLGINALTKSLPPAKAVFAAIPDLAKINLNKVSLGELLDTRCIPPKLAERIIALRSQKGEFDSLEELREIKGIGENRYEKLKEFFYLE